MLWPHFPRRAYAEHFANSDCLPFAALTATFGDVNAAIDRLLSQR